jgi:hypothetical protein
MHEDQLQDRELRVEPIPRYVVRYFDQDWEEFEELSFDGAGPRSAIAALSTWLAVMEGKDGPETAAFRQLARVAAVTVEVQNG